VVAIAIADDDVGSVAQELLARGGLVGRAPLAVQAAVPHDVPGRDADVAGRVDVLDRVVLRRRAVRNSQKSLQGVHSSPACVEGIAVDRGRVVGEAEMARMCVLHCTTVQKSP
jgi:hypothetical protein